MRKNYSISALVIVALTFVSTNVFAMNPASDVIGTRYEAAVRSLYEQGIVSGYPDGKFKPNLLVNRAEFVALVMASMKINASPVLKNCFTDVTDQWFAPSVCYAKLRGWVSGYPDGMFRPTRFVNKVEAFAVMVRAHGLVDAPNHVLAFNDLMADGWYVPALRASDVKGLIEEKSGKLYPATYITRGRMSDIVYRFMSTAVVQNSPVTPAQSVPQYGGGGGGGGGSVSVAIPAPATSNDSVPSAPASSVPAAPAANVNTPAPVVPPVATPVQVPNPTPVPAPTPAPIPVANRQRLTAQNFAYLGAFRLPKEANGGSRFGYGGGALALNPHGDPAGQNDGYLGSLYIVGHENDQLVAEVTIPVPKKQSGQSVASLSTASYLQGFADITGGKAQTFDAGNGYRVDGLVYLEAQNPQNSGKLYWTARTYYNVDTSDDLSHGMSDTNLSNPNAQGMWRLANFHGLTTGGYIFPAPQYFADLYLGGKRLISGLSSQQGVSGTSQGPAFFAFGPWFNYSGTNPPQNGAVLNAQKLVSYPYTGQPDADRDPPSNFPDYQVPDSWDAAAWVYTPTQHAVVVTGHRAMGATYYGDARPNDCTIYKGYHGEPYEPRVIFYDPADLALSAQGLKDPATIVPYAEWNPAQYLVNTCMWDLTGAAYDSERGLFYLLHANADVEDGEPTPLVYVFSVR